MSPESPRQVNMFTGELDDTRTRKQKKLDRERALPKQQEMFSQREIAQFGVNPNPLLPLSPNTRLLLIPEDPRTPKEIEQARLNEANRRTYAMFRGSPDEGEQTLSADDT